MFSSQIWTFENKYEPQNVTHVTILTSFLYKLFMKLIQFDIVYVNVLTNSFCIK